MQQRRPNMNFMDAVRENMAVEEVTEEDAEVRNEWRWNIWLWRLVKGEAERRRRIEGNWTIDTKTRHCNKLFVLFMVCNEWSEHTSDLSQHMVLFYRSFKIDNLLLVLQNPFREGYI